MFINRWYQCPRKNLGITKDGEVAMMVRRKGQAAMEFLMTYGWAILVVLAAIGALAYFGVLSPDRFLPDKCTANPPFACTEYKISETADSVYFALQNSAGVDISISNIMLGCNGTNTHVPTTPDFSTENSTVQNGNSLSVTWASAELPPAGCAALEDGNKFKATYEITYTKAGETVSHTGSGSIQVRVEA